MKIALIDVNYQGSSTGKIVSDLESGLNDYGHTTLVLFGRGSDPMRKNVVKISTNLEVLFHLLATRLTGYVDYFSPFSTNRLIRNLEKFNPDIVHLHDLHGYFVNIIQLVDYLKKKKIPIAWTFHSEFMYTGKCGHSHECDKWKTQCFKCPSLREYPKSLFFDFTFKMYNDKKKLFKNLDKLYLVSPSRWLENRMKMSMVRDKNIGVIGNGIDISIFNRVYSEDLKKELNINNEYIVLSVGSDIFSEAKGGKWLIELAKRFIGSNIIFIAVGAKSFPGYIPPNVRVLPTITDQNLLAKYYSLANVLVLTSAKETFSMVCAESLACGTPIVGFDSGAPKEVALPGFGLFVPYADIDSLVEVVLKLKNGEIKLATTDECIRFAKSRYSKRIMVENYISIYRKLIES